MNPLVTTGIDAGRRAATALSVNVNKVALLRNTRALGIPSVLRAATRCLEAGAHGITVHPRPDERHIRPHDVRELAALMERWPQAEYNIEGNPLHNLMDYVRDLRPHQATFVPDSVEQSTSDHGWRFPQDAERLAPLIAEARSLGVRVSLFMDPLPEAMAAVRALGAERVELYTERYARVAMTGAGRGGGLDGDRGRGSDGHDGSDGSDGSEGLGGPEGPGGQGGAGESAAPGADDVARVLAAFTATAEAAITEGLGINAGHDLNRDNLTAFLLAVPGVQEVSIGHALIADALEMGYTEAVRDYLRCIHRAQAR